MVILSLPDEVTLVWKKNKLTCRRSFCVSIVLVYKHTWIEKYGDYRSFNRTIF